MYTRKGSAVVAIRPDGGACRAVEIAWQSDSGGKVTINFWPGELGHGALWSIEHRSVDAATCDVALYNKAGVDILAGQGAARSATSETLLLAESYSPSLAAPPPIEHQPYTLKITNAGNAKRGHLVLRIENGNSQNMAADSAPGEVGRV